MFFRNKLIYLIWFTHVTMAMLSEATSTLYIVIGDGINPASCNFSALSSGISSMYAMGSSQIKITFNCSPAPTIIYFTDHIWLYGNVTIDGTNLVTLDGGGIYRHFVIGTPMSVGTGGYGTIVNLRNIALQNGGGYPPIQVRRNLGYNYSQTETVGKRDGGCVNVLQGAVVSIDDVMFKNCTTNGIYVEDTQGLGNDVTFLGGAMFLGADVTLKANNAVFMNNIAGQEGGAIYALESEILPIPISIFRCTFDGNQALGPYNAADHNSIIRGGGGAIFLFYSSIYVSRTKFVNNKGLYGGAIRSYRSDLFIDGCLFENNTALPGQPGNDAGRGGALYLVESSDVCTFGRNTMRITNSVFRGNKSPTYSAVLFLILSYPSNQTVFLENITMCNNPATNNNIMFMKCLHNMFISMTSVYANRAKMYTSSTCTTLIDDVRSDGSVCTMKTAALYSSSLSNVILAAETYPFPPPGNNELCAAGPITIFHSSSTIMESITATADSLTTTTQSITIPVTHEDSFSSSIENNTTIISQDVTSSQSTEMSADENLFSQDPVVVETVPSLAISEAEYSECKSFWNDNEPHLAVDLNPMTCYESGLESTSWWMARFSDALKHVSRLIITGEIWGRAQFRIGPNYSPFERPHFLTDTNTLCASLPFKGRFVNLSITCSTPITGLYLSMTVETVTYPRRVMLCDVILDQS